MKLKFVGEVLSTAVDEIISDSYRTIKQKINYNINDFPLWNGKRFMGIKLDEVYKELI